LEEDLEKRLAAALWAARTGRIKFAPPRGRRLNLSCASFKIGPNPEAHANGWKLKIHAWSELHRAFES
jgi:hypothetical protein